MDKTTTLPGADVWRLYDTFGFPVDLTRIIAEENGLQVDEAEFEAERERSIAASKAGKKDAARGSKVALDVHTLAELEATNVVKTNDRPKFAAENLDSVNATVVAIVLASKGLVNQTEATESVGIVVDLTNFYSEAGGQVADIGKIVGPNGSVSVADAQNYGGYIVHSGDVIEGSLQVGDSVSLTIDTSRRHRITLNHSATHILNYALDRTLSSESIDQKGSLVAPDKLRFDFSCAKSISADQLAAIQSQCQELVDAQLPVYAADFALESVRQIPGLRAVFGEAYPNPVRVVSIGADVDAIRADQTNSQWSNYSIELCGGTHVQNTSAINSILITEEFSIAKGIRRIVAVTGTDAAAAIATADSFAAELDLIASLSGNDLDAALKASATKLDSLNISLIQKNIFRSKHSSLKKAHLDAEKRLKTVASDKLAQLFAESPAPFYVLPINLNGNSKALANAVTYSKSLKPATAQRPVFVLDTYKLNFACFVPAKSQSPSFAANLWAGNVASALSALNITAKFGGSALSAQGSVSLSPSTTQSVDSLVQVIVSAATDFATASLS
ncbi:Alanine-tRNA ligase, mitochondrial [Zancudomyces culisetae]|uniref:alanine--tRNA ligase n=1 Tax=Zancudomyces culisetae TaxID=1213189 RepID=A0A1R1PIU0_ZANCU|nr:Alanine-tRNA ligase, mitochondrial [Zancudomyces culisetae]|eukprot:OMH80839.1 Alanine-tRNA ligase, mitochondrial [Zancudomyces culisetae]